MQLFYDDSICSTSMCSWQYVCNSDLYGYIHAYYIFPCATIGIYIYIYQCNIYSVKIMCHQQEGPRIWYQPLQNVNARMNDAAGAFWKIERRGDDQGEGREWNTCANFFQSWPFWSPKSRSQKTPDFGSRKKTLTKGPSQGPGNDCISGETEEFQHISGPINDVPRSKDGHVTKNTLENTENSWLVGLFLDLLMPQKKMF